MQIVAYYKYQVESVGPDEFPPHSIVRKCLYMKVVRIQGFVRYVEHPHCIQIGICQLSASPNGNYMGHMYV